MENKERLGSSGIGGQAVIEGIMMRNKDKYAVAVRKPDKSIDVDIQECGGIAKKYKITTLPFIRGISYGIYSVSFNCYCSCTFYDFTIIYCRCY